MTITSAEINIVDSNLMVKGQAILANVPKNVILTANPDPATQGVFLGVSSSESSNRHVFTLGTLKELRFMCCFRFNLWWMTQRIGLSGRDVPFETQFLLLECSSGSKFSMTEREINPEDASSYVVFLPLLDGPVRTCLQGSHEDELQLCMESGCPDVKSIAGERAIFIHSGADPFQVVADAVRAVEIHLQTFRRRENKKMPGILNWFGWCTWDAFYTDVTPEGIKQGLKSLQEGGTPAKLIIVDDGWQSAATDDAGEDVNAGAQFSRRLIDIKENCKFSRKCSSDGSTQEASETSLKRIVSEIKNDFSVKYVYVWHALAGYWGGVRTTGTATQKFESKIKYPVHSPGILSNQASLDMAAEKLTINGLGLVHPKKVFQFYNELHSYLAEAGVDGVKVDVQNILETLAAGFGGRVTLTRLYQQSLEASISRHFPDNGCIACMSHNTDGLYSIKQTAVVRASDDFWPRDPASHTIHIASVAYNSVFLGEFMQPDWDMFHSLHPAAEYHAAARAVGGCPVYVSDKPGQHDFDVLTKLVLPDGSILRAQLPGRPSRDNLFSDPTRDGKSLLKIWNMNKHTGVLGVFNCQGAGWCKQEKANVIHNKEPATITGTVRAGDVDWLMKITPEGWIGDCAIFTHKGGELICLPKNTALPVTLRVLEYEIFTISPVKKLGAETFAPIGLLNMFNSGGAIMSLEYESVDNDFHTEFDEKPVGILDFANPEIERAATAGISIATIRMKAHGCGKFGVYSSVRPKECWVDKRKVDIHYDSGSGLMTFILPETSKQLQDVVIEV